MSQSLTLPSKSFTPNHWQLCPFPGGLSAERSWRRTGPRFWLDNSIDLTRFVALFLNKIHLGLVGVNSLMTVNIKHGMIMERFEGA